MRIASSARDALICATVPVSEIASVPLPTTVAPPGGFLTESVPIAVVRFSVTVLPVAVAIGSVMLSPPRPLFTPTSAVIESGELITMPVSGVALVVTATVWVAVPRNWSVAVTVIVSVPAPGAM